MSQPTGGYSADEISAVAQSLVQTSVRYQTDSLGVRQTQTIFSDVQQAALGLFLLFPTAPFYVVQLGCSRLEEELQTQAQQVAQLLTLVQASGRSVLPVNDVSPLVNAKVALYALSGTSASRTSSFSSIQAVPAFQTFSKNVSAFLAQNGSSVVSSGQVVPTPQDAKTQMKTLLSTVLSTQQDLISKATFLKDALVNYNSADLPAVAASSTFQSATQSIATLVAQLEQQSPTQRLESLRATVLQLLATQAIIGQVGGFNQPGNVFPFTGTAIPYSDSSHAANPATLSSTRYAPYNITGAPIITIALDGGVPQSFNLNNGLFADIFGTKTEPFAIATATAAKVTGSIAGPFTITSGNNTLSFSISIPGSPPVSVSLTTTLSGSQTATALTGDLNSQLSLVTSLYEIVAVSNHLQIDSKTNLGSSYGVTINAGSMSPLVGFSAGHTGTGVDDNTTLKVEETVSSTIYTVVFTPGSYTAVQIATFFNGAGTPFTAGAQGNVGSQFLDIRYTGTVPTPTFSAGMQFPAAGNTLAPTLGFATGVTFKAQPATARSVVANLNQLFTTLNATVAVDPITMGSNLNIRSEPTDPTRLVAYLTSGTGTAASVGFNTIQLSTPAGLLASGVLAGDTLVIRTGVNTNTKWTITVVTDTSVTATGIVSVTPGNCTYEIGPTFTLTPGYVIQIPSGINNGIYAILQQGPTGLAVPFEFEVGSIVHGLVQSNGQPYVSTGSVGQEKVVFNSENTTISSSVSVSGSASSYFFTGTAPFTAIGTTPWLYLSAQVPGLGVGDTAEYFNSHYNIPDQSFVIQSLNENILGISPAISDTLSLSFPTGVQPPFSQLISGAYTAFQTLSVKLKAWLALPANQSSFTASLQLAMNVVMSEPQTTAFQIQTALTLLLELQNLLLEASSSSPTTTLEFALLNYSVNRVLPVDNLVTTYTEQAATRALDMLIEGQFSEFFGLTQDGVSYAGAMQSQIRTIAQNDLPVRKVDRSSTVTSQVASSSTSPDFEYASPDIDSTINPVIPTNFEQVGPANSNNS